LWESTEISRVSNLPTISPVQSKISNEHERNVGTEKPEVTKSPAVSLVLITTRSSTDMGINDEITYAPVDASILKIVPQNLPTVSKIVKNNNNK